MEIFVYLFILFFSKILVFVAFCFTYYEIQVKIKVMHVYMYTYTAISRKVVGKMCTRQSRKVLWDMINTLFLTAVAVEPTFVAFH